MLNLVGCVTSMMYAEIQSERTMLLFVIGILTLQCERKETMVVHE